VVSFTLQLLHLQGKNPWFPLNWRLDGPQSQSGQRRMRKKEKRRKKDEEKRI
jgi:hypothetical protein